MFKNGILFLILLVVLAGCRESQHSGDHAAVQIDLRAGSQAVGQTELTVSLSDSDNNPVNNATVTIKGDMDHAGMQPVLAEIENGTDGIYTVPFEWTMAGDWIVEVAVSLPDDTTTTETFEYTISGEMAMDDSTEEAAMNMDADATDEPAMAGMDHSGMNMGSGPVSAAYMVITNNGDAEDALVAVETDAAAVVEIHETTMTEDDVMQMRPLEDGAAIPVGEAVALQPGGIHIMLIDVQQDLVAGEILPLTLIFASGAEVEIEAVIQDEAPAGVTIEAEGFTIVNPWVRPVNR